MDDTAGMGPLKRIRHSPAYPDGFLLAQRSLGQNGVQFLTFQKLHDKVGNASKRSGTVVSCFEDLDDRGVAKVDPDLGFPLEIDHETVNSQRSTVGDFDGYRLVGIVSARVDGGSSAIGEHGAELVVSQFSVFGQRRGIGPVLGDSGAEEALGKNADGHESHKGTQEEQWGWR